MLLFSGHCLWPLHFVDSFSQVAAGRLKFVIVALAVALGLSTLLTRLPRRWERAVAWGVVGIFLARFSIVPFLMPVVVADELAGLETTFDSAGVCLQSTTYTCGPAAAVTALKRLGLSGQEGQIATWAHTCPWVGTLPVCLSEALEDRYTSRGLQCRFRRFDSVDELSRPGGTLVVVKDTFRRNHCMAVLGVSNDIVTLADPALGVTSMSRQDFESIWRFADIVLTRSHHHSQMRSGLDWQGAVVDLSDRQTGSALRPRRDGIQKKKRPPRGTSGFARTSFRKPLVLPCGVSHRRRKPPLRIRTSWGSPG